MDAAASPNRYPRPRRRAVVIGISEFDTPGEYPPLGFAPARAEELAQQLRQQNYDVAVHCAGPGPTVETIEQIVDDMLSAAGPDDASIVHVLSHGRTTATNSLALVGSQGTHARAGRPEAWIRTVEDNCEGNMPRVLFLIDTCLSGTAARLPWQSATSHDPRAWVLAAAAPPTAAPHHLAYEGWFTQATASVIRDLNSGFLDVSESLEHAPLDLIARRISQEVSRLADGYPQRVTGTTVDIAALPNWPFFSNPRYRAGEQDGGANASKGEDLQHFVNRARGLEIESDATLSRGCFAGRRSKLRYLTPWVDGLIANNLCVITGMPGSGKSALMGIVVCAAHPELRHTTEGLWERIEVAPSLNVSFIAVHARGLSVSQVLEQIAVRLACRDRPLTVGALIEWARRRLKRPFILAIDAIDEAENPAALSEAILRLGRASRRTSREDRRGIARVLVGTRAGTKWPETSVLVATAQRQGSHVDLDAVDDEEIASDLYAFVDGVLRRSPAYETADMVVARHKMAATVSQVLTDNRDIREWGEFLVASLFVHYILNEPPARTTEQIADLLSRIPQTLHEVLELDLGARLGETPWVRELLAALALSSPTAVPFEVLAVMAGEFSLSQSDPTLAEVRSGIDALRFYLRRSVDSEGAALYQVFHQALIDYLVATAATTKPTQERRMALYKRLLGSVASANGRRQWQNTAPYLRRHIFGWSESVALESELLDDPGFIAHSAADPLSTYLSSGVSRMSYEGRLRAAYEVPRTTYPGRKPSGSSSNQHSHQLLSINAARAGDLDLSAAFAESGNCWHTRWATGSKVGGLLSWSPPFSLDVRCVHATGSVLATVGVEGTVRLWNQSTGALIASRPFHSPGRMPTSVVLHHADSSRLIVHVSTATEIRSWGFDRATGSWTGEESRRLPSVSSTGLRPQSGVTGDVTLLAGIDGSTTWLDTGTLTVRGRWSHGDGLVSGAIALRREDSLLFVSAGFDGALTAVGSEDHERVWRSAQLHRGGITAVTQIGTNNPYIVAAGLGRRLVIVDSATGEVVTHVDGGLVSPLLASLRSNGNDFLLLCDPAGVVEVRTSEDLEVIDRLDVPGQIRAIAGLDGGGLSVACQGDVIVLDPPSPY